MPPVVRVWLLVAAIAGAVYAGVMVVPSARMARRLSATVPQLAVPEALIDLIDRDDQAGVRFAVDLVQDVEALGRFDGVHLVPVSRSREVATALLGLRG